MRVLEAAQSPAWAGTLQHVTLDHAAEFSVSPRTQTPRRNIFHALTTLTVKETVFLHLNSFSSTAISAHYFLPCHWIPQRKVCLYLLLQSISLPTHLTCISSVVLWGCYGDSTKASRKLTSALLPQPPHRRPLAQHSFPTPMHTGRKSNILATCTVYVYQFVYYQLNSGYITPYWSEN